MFHEITCMPVLNLHYVDFMPQPYLAFCSKRFANRADGRDVAKAIVAALDAALADRGTLFTTVMHHQRGAPSEVAQNFDRQGADWLDAQRPGATLLLRVHGIEWPTVVEQHDLSDPARLLAWQPRINIINFVRDLAARVQRQEDVHVLRACGRLPEATT